ncbi:hypothetical protein SASPL_101379 [Salvia splendens]|uniref:Transmembrane protein 45B n=1 Tax=Salvia splendens TaxID=180675 RepID=A0A8X8YRR9_SALSN|nr:uncharacterized protein LOC121803878 [Salvia splendens]KAG6436479.1 hypothetical protein SASPL_101379 [Salvia splendens]
MGNLRGHVVYGAGFSLIGVWHLINHSKLHTLNPTSYTAPTWFPTSPIKFLELYFIMSASAAAVFMDLFIGLRRHHPFSPDGTIPSSHLHSFEHSIIALSIFAYALSTLLLEKSSQSPATARRGLSNAVATVALGVELLVFHLHSADHMGVEGQYHLLLQAVIAAGLAAAALSGAGYDRSLAVAYVKSVGIFFQGVWLVVMGFMLWTPRLVFLGCFMNWENGSSFVVRCEGEEALMRARSLVNIQFSLLLVGVNVVALLIYLIVFKIYSNNNVSTDFRVFGAIEMEILDK